MRAFLSNLNNLFILKVLGVSFLIAFAFTYFLVPVVSIMARRLGAVDKPDNNRKIHRKPTPRLGGIAIYAGIISGVAASLLVLNSMNRTIFIDMKLLTAICIGSTFVMLLGSADDFLSLKPSEKYLGQVIASVIAILFGINFSFLNLPVAGTVSLGFWSYLFTIFWITAMMNMVNFIDGLDGLAAGVSAIAGVSFLFFLVSKQNLTLAILMAALVGGAIGFLKYNFHPAKIFMGDSGSLLLGYIFGVVSISGVLKSMSAFSLLVPLVIMGVPILDTFLAIIRRYFGGKPISEADSKHIHHKLLHRGLSHRTTVLIIYVWSAFLAFTGYAVSYGRSFTKVLLLLVSIFLTTLILIYTGMIEELRIVINERKRQREK